MGSTSQIAALFDGDLKEAEGYVNGMLKVQLTQQQFDALVDFTFNLGCGHLAGSHLLKNLNAGQTVTETNFTDWAIHDRRVAEWRMFSKGDYGG